MAAYAALVSVMHTIEQVQNHPRPPISLDNTQVESLTEKVTFLQDFLEGYSINGGGSEDANDLESRIADAAYAAEDIIESHIVDQIQPHGKKFSFISFFQGLFYKATSHEEKINSIDFYDGLQKVIQDLDLIKRDVMEIAKRTGDDQLLHRSPMSSSGSLTISASSMEPNTTVGIDDQLLHGNPVSSSGSLRRSASSMGPNTMIGFDDILIEIMGKLTGQISSRQITPIVGMGGIGKTTLARNIYVNPLVAHHFDLRGWATISQEHDSKEILLQVLVGLKSIGSTQSLGQKSEHELGEMVYKTLIGRRYLIVMDDIWSIEAWDSVKIFFPEDNNGSRIVITTRLSNLAFQLSGSCGLEMSFLDEDRSWNLFCKTVFGEERFPRELGDIGKKIVKNCKGLPLSVVIVGGLLAKSKRTREYWLYIAENLNAIVNLEDDERCLRILRLSYVELPVHLKPCFLYMAVFPEDEEIYVANLMRLWVAEGFVKPFSGKCLEIVAQECFNDLIGRNLVLVSERTYTGKVKYCKIHDLLLDICIREAQKRKFLCVTRKHNLENSQGLSSQRRIVIHDGTKNETIRAFCDLASLVRSLTHTCSSRATVSSDFKLLRVWHEYNLRSLSYYLFPECTRGIVNCRYICQQIKFKSYKLPSTICRLWNLQTLMVSAIYQKVTPTLDIWKMPQLRHVVFYPRLHLQDPVISTHMNDEFVVLENLQTLQLVKNFKCGEEVVKRIPNIKELGIHYADVGDYYLENLFQLCELGILSCGFDWALSQQSRISMAQHLSFPHSLNELTLGGTNLPWEEMQTKISSLPCLQVLQLHKNAFIGATWETVEGQFRNLKYLNISDCRDLEYWSTESSHFPCLERLILHDLIKLKEIPLEIGDIPTLEFIELTDCTNSAIISAKEILQRQEDLGNEGLQVSVGGNIFNLDLHILIKCA